MANKVFANTREIACKAAKGKTICAFPDVCFTPPDKVPPTPPGIPIPYPNTGMASDTTQGSKKVQISNKEIVLKNKSYFKQSTGDEAGCAQKKGVITSKTKGKVYFQMWSMDVKVEGMNVARHLDMTTNNHASQPGDTPPWPYVDSMAMNAEQKKACNKDKKKEKQACEEYKPHKKDGLDVCAEAGLAGDISRNKGTATRRANQANANKCAAARRCQLLPYNAKPRDGINGCCPAQTPDHIVPKSSFFVDSVSDGTKVDGWDNYNMDEAPCMCLEGANNTHGSHGLRHAHHKAFSDAAKGEMVAFKKEAAHCAEGAKAVAPQCEQKCIEAQLANGHKGMGDQRKKVKHSPSGPDQTQEEINAAISQQAASANNTAR
ncbi:type VI secretion system effector Dnase Tse7 [Bowmanella denitrificans]|uniref:Type VI secretion system effector Dnase Tse7 n=1 Tax=Bowmanella denitrificans TaxID=366582 RepID=A0ABN0XA91_9ALTE